MTTKNNFIAQPIDYATLGKRMLIGTGIALIPIVFFLVSAGEPDPSWSKLWMIRPLIIVPLAGACGGVFYHLMDPLRNRGGWRKAVANILSAIVFVIGLWLGFVLGFNGTYWN